MAGIRAARGNWIATLDADLQNDPADLVRLWRALPGHDAALGWRVQSTGRLVQTTHQLLGESATKQGVGPVHSRHGLLGPDLPAGDRLAIAGVQRHAPVFRLALVARGMPAGSSTRSSSTTVSRPVALPFLEPVVPGGHRPTRSDLVDAPATTLSDEPNAGSRRDNCQSTNRRLCPPYHGIRPHKALPGGLSRVEPDILADDWFLGPVAIYRAIPDTVGGFGKETRFRGTGGVLVAQLAGRHGTLGLCDFPTRPRDYHRARNGAFRLLAKPDVGGQGKGQTGSIWVRIGNRCSAAQQTNNCKYNDVINYYYINDIWPNS